MSLERESILECLSNFTEPHLLCDLPSAGCIKQLEISDELIDIVIELGFPTHQAYRDYLRSELAEHLTSLTDHDHINITIDSKINSHAVQAGVKPLNEIKNIIAVASGKGGVGKSTVAANIALALQLEGARVGVLDADIYGPSQTRMLGIRTAPEAKDEKHMLPLDGHGLQVMSAGALIDEDTPMIWRGPMVTRALEQLVSETAWQGLDYLIVDMPPGTGDIQLTLAQRVPVSGAVIVTTPQDIALLDARKGLKMFEKVGVEVLGIIENMGLHICSNCGHEEPIFGSGGGQQMAAQYGVQLLGSLPLDITIREQTDSGKPTVIATPESRIAEDYRRTARQVAAQLSLRKLSSGSAFPDIQPGK
ncbi:scaffold protein for [4Fe-4S [Halorhodospira halochloris]|uniref:Iron-sulfur cluster carrier protein n=1 Tax=Halorhodospira halochloris TaxID=1052 RepID=A0A0X8XA34_HALHR|nr:iron-sulfur cluster carrier protein ApbC [Halorhodospira halochloris]MBK1651985.1 Fe-S-binding ATPase [Halorhodospira halochloris]BAU58281.1 scaffold protein for [4Fe-4S [Halorhodospira halochloris]